MEVVSGPAAAIAACLARIPITVRVVAGTGHGVADDWWELTLDELRIGCVGLSLAEAEQNLALAVQDEVQQRIDEEQLSPDEAAVVIRLYLAMLAGDLPRLLLASQVAEEVLDEP